MSAMTDECEQGPRCPACAATIYPGDDPDYWLGEAESTVEYECECGCTLQTTARTTTTWQTRITDEPEDLEVDLLDGADAPPMDWGEMLRGHGFKSVVGLRRGVNAWDGPKGFVEVTDDAGYAWCIGPAFLNAQTYPGGQVFESARALHEHLLSSD